MKPRQWLTLKRSLRSLVLKKRFMHFPTALRPMSSPRFQKVAVVKARF
ncbi:Uncharacterised protein [Vibrio cholerae]|nr:Uncharacterised protein [Vibrio cholerae]